MLVTNSKLIGAPVLSVQTGNPVGHIASSIVDPDGLKIIAFRLEGPLVDRTYDILDVSSIREYSNFGFVIDNVDELVAASDVIRIQNILELNFDLLSLKVETKKGTKLGHIIDFTVTSEDFILQQIIVKRPAIKALVDPELTISRQEIVEITDYKVIVRDEENIIKARAEKEDFIPNFVNPFRSQKQDFVPADNQNLADKDTE